MADYQDDWLRRIEEKVDLVLADTAQLKPLKDQFVAHVKEDSRLFHGNGQPGLILQLDRIKQEQTKFNDERRQLIRVGIILLLVAAGVGGSVPELVKAAIAAFIK